MIFILFLYHYAEYVWSDIIILIHELQLKLRFCMNIVMQFWWNFNIYELPCKNVDVDQTCMCMQPNH